MRIVIAPDSFKESLSADKVCCAIAKGIKKVDPKAKIVSVPMADGGEGTMSAIMQSVSGKIESCKVTAPLSNKVKASYGLIDANRTAIIEMAQASGLTLVPPSKRNPLITTSVGTGEMVRIALDKGCEKIILTLGGIATNDAGVGIAQALGYRFLDKNEKEIPCGVRGLKFLHRIDTTRVHPRINKVKFVAACDVKNPLCGPKGSAAIYGPQKGATPKMIKEIDLALHHFTKIVERDLKIKVLNLPGAGAAGGAGAGTVAFLNAELKPGIDIVIEATQLNKKVFHADLVITGEGKIDGQTVFGKTPVGVAKIAKRHGIPVIAFCGKIGPGAEKVHSAGIDAIFTIVNGPISYEESLKNAEKLLEKSSEEVFRLLKSICIYS